MKPSFKEEKKHWEQEKNIVSGVDEAGRGPLAGAVIAAAVTLPRDFSHLQLTDSKKLTPKARERIFTELTTREGIDWAVGEASVEEIESLNILRATWKAMERAVSRLRKKPDHVLIDGLEVKGFPFPQTAIVKGDGKSLSIAAASVIAKVWRDRLMLALDEKYPQYGFATHKGYGTKKHLEALSHFGPCPAHRRSFRPVALAATAFEKRAGGALDAR